MLVRSTPWGTLVGVLLLASSARALDVPVVSGPGGNREPGAELGDVTPRLGWYRVREADRYGVYVSEAPYGAANLIYENEGIAGDQLELRVPAGRLRAGGKYRWNMRAFKGKAASDFSAPCYFYVKSEAAAGGGELPAPLLAGPGGHREPGAEIGDVTPRLGWYRVREADRYGVYVSEAPYGAANLIYENEGIAGDQLELRVPAGKLRAGGKYRWNMRAFKGKAASDFSIACYLHVKAGAGGGAGSTTGATDKLTPAQSAVKWALARVGQSVQPCRTRGCRYNLEQPGNVACSTPNPEPADEESEVDDATGRPKGTVDRHRVWYGWCGEFVKAAYDETEAIGSATQLYRRLEQACEANKSNGDIPVGALVFWRFVDVKAKVDYGHVGLHVGGGSIVHSGSNRALRGSGVRNDRIDVIHGNLGKDNYRGWFEPTGVVCRKSFRV